MLTTSEIIKKYKLQTKKSFGQNFLLDSNLTDKVAKCAGDLINYEVLEIGPGPGGLTRSILKINPKKLIVIETDERCIQALEKEFIKYRDKLKIISADALRIKEADYFKNKIKIISNLPYNIGTVLLFKWLSNAQNFESLTLMFQKEVAERIVAKPCTKQYGRLSIMCQFLCDVNKHFDIKPTAFVPQPKVTSSVVSLYPKKEYCVKDVNINNLSKLTQLLFSQRRKMVKSILKSKPNAKEILKKCDISENKRPEELSIKNFALLSKELEL